MKFTSEEKKMLRIFLTQNRKKIMEEAQKTCDSDITLEQFWRAIRAVGDENQTELSMTPATMPTRPPPGGYVMRPMLRFSQQFSAERIKESETQNREYLNGFFESAKKKLPPTVKKTAAVLLPRSLPDGAILADSSPISIDMILRYTNISKKNASKIANPNSIERSQVFPRFNNNLPLLHQTIQSEQGGEGVADLRKSDHTLKFTIFYEAYQPTGASEPGYYFVAAGHHRNTDQYVVTHVIRGNGNFTIGQILEFS